MRNCLATTGLIGVLLGSLAAQAAADDTFVKEPYIQNVQPTRVTIIWETAARSTGVVEYGPTKAMGLTVKSLERGRIHEAVLKGLKPKTTYHYRVWAGKTPSEVATFTTAFHGEGAFSFAVYGDTRSYPERHARVVKLIERHRPDFVLHTGDLVDSGSTYDHWYEQFFGPAGRLMRSVCVWPALGNHEEDADWYYRFFAVPEPERWYTFRWGNARFICLDSNRRIGADSRQMRWFQGVLEANKSRWTIVYLHYPAYSGGPHGGDHRLFEACVPLMEKHGVDIVSAGHNHLYERSYRLRDGKRGAERGILHVTSAGGGATPYAFQPEPAMAVAASTLHACFVRVDGLNLTLEARSADGDVLDALELTKDRRRIDRLLADLAKPGPAAAIAELGRLGVTKAAPKMIALLTAEDLKTRRAAAEALARLNVPKGAEALAKLVMDTDAAVRAHAIRGLARTREAACLGAVTGALDDKEAAVVIEGVRGLVWMGSGEAAVPLVRLIKRPGLELAVLREAALALGYLKRGRPSYDFHRIEDVEPLLTSLLNSRDLRVAAEAAEGLERHNTAMARSALCLALGRFYEESREHDKFDKEVLGALRKIGDRSCGETLLAYVADRQRRGKNRRRAAGILNKLTGLDPGFDDTWSQKQVETAVRQWRTALKGSGT